MTQILMLFVIFDYSIYILLLEYIFDLAMFDYTDVFDFYILVKSVE